MSPPPGEEQTGLRSHQETTLVYELGMFLRLIPNHTFSVVSSHADELCQADSGCL